MYHRILVALDGSDLAERALPHAEALAEKFGATLVLLRATAPPEDLVAAEAAAWGVGPAPMPIVDPTAVLTAEQQEARRYLQTVERRLTERGLTAEHELVEAHAAEAIVRRARERRADLVAMTTHGRGGLGRLLLGSVADDVVRHAPCPVLLVRARDEDDGSEG